MEAMIRECSQLALSSSCSFIDGCGRINRVYNPSPWPLFIAPCNYPTHRGVYSRGYIPSQTYLGELEGERIYSWEIPEEEYDNVLWVMEDCVLRYPKPPASRNILTYVREGFYMGLKTNCSIHIETTLDGDVRVGLKTTCPIYENQELLYWHPGLV